MGRNRIRVVLALVLVCTAACGDDDDGDKDAGVDGGTAGSGGSGSRKDAGKDAEADSGGGSGGSTSPPPLECGSQTCDEVDPLAAMLGVSACCTPDDVCGQQTLSSDCLAPGISGGIDPGCPRYDVMGLASWYGCCTPQGQCGAQAGGALGCVANSELMVPEQSCSYDPGNTCERLIEVKCDGPEDCGAGQQCCAVFDNGYRRLECTDGTCADREMFVGGSWSEVCHPGQVCSVGAYTCTQTDYLPDYLFRCRDSGSEPQITGLSTSSGEVNCGDQVCGSGQKCCVSVPGVPTCVAADADCTCTPQGSAADAGTEDAG